jgi:hypothetical protein
MRFQYRIPQQEEAFTQLHSNFMTDVEIALFSEAAAALCFRGLCIIYIIYIRFCFQVGIGYCIFKFPWLRWPGPPFDLAVWFGVPFIFLHSVSTVGVPKEYPRCTVSIPYLDSRLKIQGSKVLSMLI